MAGREVGGSTGAMEEGRDGGEARYESSEDGSASGNDMISVQFMQKVWLRNTTASLMLPSCNLDILVKKYRWFL